MGIFVRFPGEAGRAAFDAMMAQQAALEAEIGAPLRGEWQPLRSAWDISLDAPPQAAASEKSALSWLLINADKLVSAFRPHLALLDAGAGGEAD